MHHTMKLNDEPFAMIASGEKTFELRLYDEKRRGISVGDTVTFVHARDASRTLHCAVVALHRFATFADLYRVLPLRRCGYTEETVKTASHTDMEVYYSEEKQVQYGVLAIEISLRTEGGGE